MASTVKLQESRSKDSYLIPDFAARHDHVDTSLSNIPNAGFYHCLLALRNHKFGQTQGYWMVGSAMRRSLGHLVVVHELAGRFDEHVAFGFSTGCLHNALKS